MTNILFHGPLYYLDGVRVRRLTQDFQQGRIRHEEKAREHQAFLLQVTRQRLLTELQLLQQTRQHLHIHEGISCRQSCHSRYSS